MPFSHKIYDNLNGGYRVEEAGVGTTLYIGSKTYQVMSDIWETGSYAVFWNGKEIRVHDWIETGVADATKEVWAAAKEWKRAQLYLRAYTNLRRTFEEDAERLVRGCEAEIVRGRKFPIGTKGKVVGMAQTQWGTNVGIALSDVMVEIEKNGRKFQNHKDVAWVAAKNVQRIDKPVFDQAAAEAEASKFAAAAVEKSHWFCPA